MIGDIVQAAAGVTAAFPLYIEFIHQHGVGTPNTGTDIDCLLGTVPGAGTAFHACVAIGDSTNLACKGEDLLRAYFKTHATAVAFDLIHLQGYHVLQVFVFHLLCLQTAGLLNKICGCQGNQAYACRYDDQGQGDLHFPDYS